MAMQKTAFIDLLNSLITPLFTGCEIVGEEESSLRDSEVAIGTNGVLMCKMDKSDEYRIILKRLLPFRNSDANLVKAILAEIGKINAYNIIEQGYIKSLQLYALEKAICKTVCEYAFNTLHGLIDELNLWSTRTYEGNNTTFGFVVDDSPIQGEEKFETCKNLHYTNILSKDFSALLCDGKTSCVELNSNGYMVNHITIPQLGFADICGPFKYVNMAHQCYINRVGLSLLPNGDMLIFRDQELVFAKRRGQWNCFSHDEIMAKLAVKPTEQNYDLRKSIYLTALDTSFAKTGGCIVYLKKENVENVLNHIDLFDIVSERYYNIKKNMEYDKIEFTTDPEEMEAFQEKYKKNFTEFCSARNAIKVKTLNKIINGRKFHDLSRVLREELVGIDGATIVDSEGEIVAVGAIIKIEAGSTGGGRLAAAKQLSKYGVAMKISADGIIEGFSYDKNNQSSKPIFSAG